ncbi:MAG TPA: ATP-binding protein [Bryobacteraceae bacterium]|nr:ATP-binding protein [Bryobacteraceae bacterium]
MLQELKFQLSTAILTILTIAASVGAIVNLGQYHKFHLPDDGIIWVDRAGHVEALYITPDSPGSKAGIHRGDRLERIQGAPISQALDVPKILMGLGAWKDTRYTIEHIEYPGVSVDARVIVGEAPRNPAVYYQYALGVIYLLIGLFVYYRRGSAQKAQHFYIFCLSSFAAFCFHYTGRLDTFDTLAYFINVGAGLFAPTIFLHFCLTFPERRRWFEKPSHVALLYLPTVLLSSIYLGVSTGTLNTGIPLVDLRWVLDRGWVLLAPLLYMIGAYIFNAEYRKADDPIVRQQLKWLRNGAVFGVGPYFAVYVLPYAFGAIPNYYQGLSVLSMVLLPLTLAYAIVRYRLMDVDILFRRGYAYTLATLCVAAVFFGTVFWLGSAVSKLFVGPDDKSADLKNVTSLIVMLTAAFLFQPIRDWIQEWLDRHFYSDRYDYRRTLVEFARELGSQMDLDTMLASVGDRLLKTLSIRHLGFFLAEDSAAGPVFRLKSLMGNNPKMVAGAEERLDLSFLDWKLPESYLFFERTHHQLDAVSRSWPASVRHTIAELDFTYYLPCKVRGRTIAYIGVSRSTDGEYLSSVDVELLLTLTGYVAIAIENASLYSSLQLKVREYERLKEFSENIVESINVGILAADLEDRVESWNSQIEQLSGVSREKALGRKLSELFPAELTDQFERVRGETGIHHIYKFVLKPAVSAAVAGGNGNGSGTAHAIPARFREATLNIAIAPLVSRDQEQIGRLIIFDDVTDRAELEQRLVQADKLSSIGLLAAGVAHEVNTPLAVISTYAQMLAKQMAEDAPQKTLILDKIAKQTFRASEIVNSLLNFSRTSSTSFGDVNLNRVVQETLSLLEHQLQKSGVQIKTELDATLPPIHGNTGKLQQVFLNLFLNARDAMSGGGTLEVRTWRDNGMVKVDVADSGHGIAPEHLRRIYDPFFTTKGAHKGTGLGLSVTYGIIQEHGGSIEVTNRPGGGARFRLELPVSRAAARTPVNAA